MHKMVYPENFESKIKFDKIRQFVQKNCLSDMGRDLVEAMKFSTEPTEIRERLEETQEFMSILEEEDQFPGDHFSDARPFLNKAIAGIPDGYSPFFPRQRRTVSAFNGPGRRYPIISLYSATPRFHRIPPWEHKRHGFP